LCAEDNGDHEGASSQEGIPSNWKSDGPIHYKNKRDLQGKGLWVMAFTKNKVCSIKYVTDHVSSVHNVFDAKTKAGCLDRAKELGLTIPEGI